MSKPTVYFAHGRESGPWGMKIRSLSKVAEAYGCRVVSLDDRDTVDPDERVARLVKAVGAIDGPLVLVGSSMGGYVVTVASSDLEPQGLFLMAPAIGLQGYALETPVPVASQLSIVHGWDDDIVPLKNVLDFASLHQAHCHLLPAGHTLQEQIDWLVLAFEEFLQRCISLEPSGISQARLIACL
jgi:pimeloyl-ACP methyl ester carboxylesterase